MDPAKYAEIFLEESREHLSLVNQQLLDWERDPNATEPVAAIFRSVHNIKGMAATMGYHTVATLAHRMENLLQGIRDGSYGVSPKIVDVIFKCFDEINSIIDSIAAGEIVPDAGLPTLSDGTAGGLERNTITLGIFGGGTVGGGIVEILSNKADYFTKHHPPSQPPQGTMTYVPTGSSQGYPTR